MFDRNHIKTPLTIRERLVIWFVLLIVRVLAPWEYEHQFKEVIGEITDILRGNSKDDVKSSQ